jgi:hypothetical protein
VKNDKHIDDVEYIKDAEQWKKESAEIQRRGGLLGAVQKKRCAVGSGGKGKGKGPTKDPQAHRPRK